MNGFIPHTKEAQKVPYYEDVNASLGWQGQSTEKTLEKLQAEVSSAMGRLGGNVSSFVRGEFQIGSQRRHGFQIHYAIQSPAGAFLPGRLDVAALPCRGETPRKIDLTLRMALYMTRNAIDGLWFLQMLSPGYAPLMPWMLAKGEKTVSQLWAESSSMALLLPPGDADFIEGEIVT